MRNANQSLGRRVQRRGETWPTRVRGSRAASQPSSGGSATPRACKRSMLLAAHRLARPHEQPPVRIRALLHPVEEIVDLGAAQMVAELPELDARLRVGRQRHLPRRRQKGGVDPTSEVKRDVRLNSPPADEEWGGHAVAKKGENDVGGCSRGKAEAGTRRRVRWGERGGGCGGGRTRRRGGASARRAARGAATTAPRSRSASSATIPSESQRRRARSRRDPRRRRGSVRRASAQGAAEASPLLAGLAAGSPRSARGRRVSRRPPRRTRLEGQNWSRRSV